MWYFEVRACIAVSARLISGCAKVVSCINLFFWWQVLGPIYIYKSLMRNYFPKRPSGASLHTLSKLYDVPVGFVTPPLFLGSV